MRLWITRTRPSAQETAARLAALGHDPVVAPLLEVRVLPLTGFAPDHETLAFTSRNAIAVWAGIDPNRSLPVFCVGDATAAAARALGYTNVTSASGNAVALAALLRGRARGPVLVPGPRQPAADMAALVGPSVKVFPLAIYETAAAEITPPTAIDGILFHSARAAETFAHRHAVVANRQITAHALSGAVARPLQGLGFGEILVAARPDEDALFETLRAETLGKPPGPV